MLHTFGFLVGKSSLALARAAQENPTIFSRACYMSIAASKPWFVYLVRAANGSLYCGISDDAQRRFAAHQSGRGARFFHSSPAVALVYVETLGSKSDALRRERAIKQMKKSAKEALVSVQSGSGPVNVQAIS